MRGLICLPALFLLAACGHDGNWLKTRQAKALIASHCAACHQVPGVAAATGRVGPSLAHIGSQQIIAGYFANNPGTLAQWIEHPQRMLPGNAMPEMGLLPDQVAAIVDYLYTMD